MICEMKCLGKVWINIFLYLVKIKKLMEVCMGFGKGVLDLWVVVVKEGKIMFEINGVSEVIVREVFCKVGYKLFIKVKIVKRGEEV